MVSRRSFVAALLVGASTGALNSPLPALAISNALTDRMGRLLNGIERVESVRAVKNLQRRFAHLFHFGQWDALGALFAENGTLEWDGARWAGPRSIADYFRAALGAEPFHAMLVMAPTVTLSPGGWHARARWHEVRMMSGPVAWASSIIIVDYERDMTGWKISRLRNYPIFAGPYDAGWSNLQEDIAPLVPHFTPLSAGRPETGVAITPEPVERLTKAGARSEALLAEDAVRNLQNAFGYYCDRKMWDDVADLFAEDCLFEKDKVGTFEGRRAIRESLDLFGPAGLRHGELNDHPQLNLIVDVDPDLKRARARGFDLGMTGVNNGDAHWSLDFFDNSFVFEGGKWKIAAMRIRQQMKADYYIGWNEEGAISTEREPGLGADPEPASSTGSEAPIHAADIDIAEIETALDRAAAFDAIENISSALGGYIDDARSYDLSRLFTADGWRKSPGAGHYQGADRIWQMQLTRNGTLSRPRSFLPMHLRIQPVIHVAEDARSAKLRTRLLQFNSIYGREGSMIGGLYEDRLAIEDGTWKFTLNDIYHIWRTASYRDGWARVEEDAGAALSRSPAKLLEVMPPDREIEGPTTATFPKITPVWFHYRNPVSGRAPLQLLPDKLLTSNIRRALPDVAVKAIAPDSKVSW